MREILLPPQADNPVDFGGRRSNQPDDIAAPVLRILADDPDVHLLFLYPPSTPFFEDRMCSPAEEALASGKPVLPAMLPGPAGERRAARLLRELRCYDSIEDLLGFEDRLVVLRGIMVDQHMSAEMLTAVAERPPARPIAILTAAVPPDPAGLIAACGIALPAAGSAAILEQVVAAADRIGYPVVGSYIRPISETGLRDDASVRQAWAEIERAASAHEFAASF